MFHHSVVLSFFLRQSFWVIVAGVLLAGQQQVSHLIASSPVAKYSYSTFNSLPFGGVIMLEDRDESPDCLPILTPEISPSIAAVLSCQQSSPQLFTSSVEGSFSLFARPPPAISFCLIS